MRTINEEGSAIVMVLVVLASVVILGVSIMNQSGVESKMSGNFKAHEMTFNLTDGTVNTTLPLIGLAILNNEIPVALVTNGLLADAASANLFYGQLTGFDDYNSDPDFDISYGSEVTDDVQLGLEVDVEIDVQRLGAKAMAGSAVKFAFGGSGFNSGTAIVYDINSFGDGPQYSRTEIESIYIKVLGL